MGTPLELLKMFGPFAFFFLAVSVGSSLAGYPQAVLPPKETCRTVYEDQSNRRCSTSYEQECSTSYSQSCSTEYVNECSTEYAKDCSYGHCKQVPQEKCRQVPRQSCKNVPRENCFNEVKKVPRTVCGSSGSSGSSYGH